MNKITLFCFIKFTTLLCGASFTSDASEKVFTDNIDTLKHEAKVLPPGNLTKRVALLMRDTTLSGNRFDYRWHKAENGANSIVEFNYQLPALLIDSTLAVRCDSLFMNDPNNSKILLTAWPRKSVSTLTKKNIRLYMGYLDATGHKYVVVQFVSPREFQKRKHIYSKELFLVVPTKKLFFVVVKIEQ